MPATPITLRHLAGLAGPMKGLLQPASWEQLQTVGCGGAQNINVQRDLLNLDDVTTTGSISYMICDYHSMDIGLVKKLTDKS